MSTDYGPAAALAVHALDVLVEWYSHGGARTHSSCPAACLLPKRIEALEALFPRGAVRYALLAPADRERLLNTFPDEVPALVGMYEEAMGYR